MCHKVECDICLSNRIAANVRVVSKEANVEEVLNSICI